MREQYLQYISFLFNAGRSLFKLAKGLSVADFTRAVEVKGGRRALNLYILPLQVSPYYAIIQRFGNRYSVDLGKLEDPENPLPIPLIHLDSEQGQTMIDELSNTVQGLIEHLSYLKAVDKKRIRHPREKLKPRELTDDERVEKAIQRYSGYTIRNSVRGVLGRHPYRHWPLSEEEHAERFVNSVLCRNIYYVMNYRIFGKYHSDMYSRPDMYSHLGKKVNIRREKKRSEFNSFVNHIFNKEDIKDGLPLREIAKRFWRYPMFGNRILKRTERKLHGYCTLGLMREENERFIPLELQLPKID